MKCQYCGSDTKEWIKVGNVYVIIHHFCAEQAKDDKIKVNKRGGGR